MRDGERILEKLSEIILRLAAIEARLAIQGEMTMSAIDDLTTQVAANTSVEASAVQLIQGIASQLSAAGTDPSKLAALTSQLNASAAALSAAILANTPAAPPAPPAPVPAPPATT